MELIIVNDGSTDETQAVLDWYRERYPQVKTFYKENGGQAAARNMGIEKAEGNYIICRHDQTDNGFYRKHFGYGCRPGLRQYHFSF